uniref:Protein E7 n=1 Tax=Alphapapillomavirus 9 TaxID=337041 RepID=A0A089G6B8_9PAPI|nr:E7 oncoprotein [Alphapapillomavirus 9]
MHGDTPTLHEYMLDLQPETTDLYCYEQLNYSSEEEDEIDGPAGQAEPDRAHYNIVTFCCKCDSTLRLCVQSTHVDIRTLEDLLMGTLGIVCPICSQKPYSTMADPAGTNGEEGTGCNGWFYVEAVVEKKTGDAISDDENEN